MKKYKDWREEQKEVFDEIVRRSPTGHQYIFRESALKFLDNIIPKGVKILDVGCGTGMYAEALGGDREWYGVDLSPLSIEKAKNYYKEAKVGDVTKHIPYPDNSFEHIFALSLLHHCYKEYPSVIKEIRRVAKNGAEVIIIDHDSRNTHSWHYTRGFTKLAPTDEKPLDFEELKKVLINNGFEITKEMFPPTLMADQQALTPPLWKKIIFVPLIVLLDKIQGIKVKGEFLIITKVRK